jgi:DNA-directed RNA polymerase subunit F
MSEENLQSAENAAPEAATPASASSGEEMMPRSEAENLLKALKAERDARKQYERDLKETKANLEKFAEINPEEYHKLQEEAAEAARLQAQWGEVRDAMEAKYSSQAQDALRRAEAADLALASYKKKYALEKVFNAAGGRTDANGGTSFFDLMAEQVGSSFRQEPDGSLTVVDAAGDPVMDKETGLRITPEEHMASYKLDPVYGTFFRGAKGAGAGIGYGGTDTNGATVEDLSSMPSSEIFKRAFG